MEGCFFSSVIDVAGPHLSCLLLHVIKNNSCQAEQRLSLPMGACGSGLGRCDLVLFLLFLKNFFCCFLEKPLIWAEGF